MLKIALLILILILILILTLLTIPQFNFRIGYNINSKFQISLGTDHMKYVMVQNQTVKINGNIDDINTSYKGIYANEGIVLKDNF